ncbi:phosphatase PAP2 family protein [Planomonospora parontospora subsp. parontospora]|uniref:Phosphatase PAP2 family protein n=2 Tax=Planomonospora parontospora TaxID=58119 RepID=A0AA37F7C9_9ACTN|nr:phosphatase PAP2 family protein [Planomonospora parontospora]GGK91940.1 phosphatase PAP2 family protein [Planomonospora parontospora]GII13152.1 phosphatase PAP2 family protein [Planomonospora parontospora subsp. parontospora]
MTTDATGFLRRVRNIAIPLGVLAVVTIALGQLITEVLTGLWAEGALNRALARERTTTWNTVSDVVSTTADTPVIISVTAVAALAFRTAFGRWRESVFIVVVVAAQSAVFLLATVFVQRLRPAVPHLDPAPPTSSYPSGHTSAAVACYCGIALVLALHTRRRAALAVVWWLAGSALAIGVAWARLYRGMHYLTDVAWGFVLGLICLAVVGRVLLSDPDDTGPPHRWSIRR